MQYRSNVNSSREILTLNGLEHPHLLNTSMFKTVELVEANTYKNTKNWQSMKFSVCHSTHLLFLHLYVQDVYNRGMLAAYCLGQKPKDNDLYTPRMKFRNHGPGMFELLLKSGTSFYRCHSLRVLQQLGDHCDSYAAQTKFLVVKWVLTPQNSIG